MKATILYFKAFFLFMIFFIFKDILNIYFFILFLQNQIRFTNIELYSKYNEEQKFKNFKKVYSPKISIISPVYNREKFLLRFIKSIHHQNFFDIEIIFVDDNSSDNSVKVIKKYMKKDKRILLIKNAKNRGTFKARNIGVLYSKGKYIIIPDPDDIISYNLINTCYYYAERHQYDLIRFNTYLGKEKLNFNGFSKNHEDRPIYQPELSTYIYYGNKELDIIDYFITNKFIKKQTYITALNSLNNFYLNMYMTFLEDSIMNYLIYRVAKSFYFINIIGYRYFHNSASITTKLFIISDLKIKFIFYYLKFIFEYSKNTKYEKDMVNHLFTSLNKHLNIKRKFSSLIFNNDEYIFYDNIFNMYINCKFIANENKMILQSLKNIINKKNQTYIKH